MPALETPTQRAANEAERRWYQDGFVNFFTGLYFLALALMSYSGQPAYGSREKQRIWYWIGFLLCTNIGFLRGPIIKWLKERVTYPRTGYASPPLKPIPDTGFFAPPMPTQAELEYLLKQEDTAKWYLAFVALLLPSFLWPNRWFCIPAGILLGVIWHRQQPHTGPTWVLPSACAIAGFAAAFLPMEEKHRMGLLICFFGAIHIFDSLRKLIAYLRRNPLPEVRQT